MSDEVTESTFQILHEIEVPEKDLRKWQINIDMLAEISEIPAALIMRVHAHEIEVFIASHSPDNVYHRGEKAPLKTGLYCEAVMSTRQRMVVPNALKDKDWDHNPDIRMGMISYCGLPLTWPDGKIFGTICIRDKKENAFIQKTLHLIECFRDSIQLSLQLIYDAFVAHKRAETNTEKGLREAGFYNRRLIESALDPLVTIGQDGKITIAMGNRENGYTDEELEAVDALAPAIVESFLLKRAEDKIHESEKKYHQLFESISNPVFLVDNETGQLYEVNTAATQLYGYSHEEFSSIRSLDISVYPQESIKSMKEKDTHVPLRWHRKKDGSLFPVEINVSYILWNGRVTRLSVIHDITDRKRAEEEIHKLNTELEQRVADRTRQLELLNKQLDSRITEIEQISYITSHDLQEPLRTLTNFTQLLNQEYSGKLDEDGNKYVEFISSSALRMRNLVSALMEYSLLGKFAVLIMVDCNKILGEVIMDMADVIKRNRASISFQDLPIVNGYETELRLLFQNLISNAIKFHKKEVPPEIKVSVENQEKDWIFSIEDNGIGFEKKHKETIFMIFRRLHNQHEYEGTGIGLAHCKKIVELHGGRIWVESTPGIGSTFLFSIPRR